jgi:hypothetical protein
LVTPCIAFALAWPFFVADGNQAAYVVATVAIALLAAGLAAGNPGDAAILVMVLATVIGTEARGEIGHGHAPFGSLRILDVGLLFALIGTGLSRYRAGVRSAGLIRGPGVLSWCVGGLLLWAAALWLAAGAPRNQFFNTDLRLIGLAVGMYLLVRAMPPSRMGAIVWALVVISPVLVLKASAIYVTHLNVIGSDDRLQATMLVLDGHRRVVLVGGDTLLILIPALCALLARAAGRRQRQMLAVAAAGAGLALLMSGTRTSLLVAVALAAGTALVPIWRDGVRLSRRAAAALVLAAALLAGGAFIFGVAQRLGHEDAPHVGLNFRFDEIRTASRLPARKLLVGQGIAGTFVSKDVAGKPVTSAWSHVLPVWLVLKVGVLGSIVALLALGAFVVRGLRIAGAAASPAAAAGVVTLIGLFAMSLALGRMALPEGALLTGLACALVVSQPAWRSSVED